MFRGLRYIRGGRGPLVLGLKSAPAPLQRLALSSAGPSSRQGQCEEPRFPRASWPRFEVLTSRGGWRWRRPRWSGLGCTVPAELGTLPEGIRGKQEVCEPRTTNFQRVAAEPFHVQPPLYTPGIKSNHAGRTHPPWSPGWLGETGGAHDEWLSPRGLVSLTELPRGCWAGQGLPGWHELVCSFREGGGRGRSPEEVTLG